MAETWTIDFLDVWLSGDGVPCGSNQITVNGDVFTIIAMSPAEKGTGRAHFTARYFRDTIVHDVEDEAQLAFAVPKGWSQMPLMHLAVRRILGNEHKEGGNGQAEESTTD